MLVPLCCSNWRKICVLHLHIKNNQKNVEIDITITVIWDYSLLLIYWLLQPSNYLIYLILYVNSKRIAEKIQNKHFLKQIEGTLVKSNTCCNQIAKASLEHMSIYFLIVFRQVAGDIFHLRRYHTILEISILVLI